MPIYTKLGDSGETRLLDGRRVSKHDPRVDAYGHVDELNAVLGVAASFVRDDSVGEVLVALQKQLLALGSELANPNADSATDKGRLDPNWVRGLERWIDTYEDELPELRKFILSGGAPGGALLHLARTVCRRAERHVVGLAEDTDVNPAIIEYINRLSDLLFVLARVVNHKEGMEEVQW